MKKLILILLALVLPACDLFPPDFPFPIPIPVPVPGEAYDCDNPPAVEGRYFKGDGTIENRIIVVMRKRDDRAGRPLLTVGRSVMAGVVSRVFTALDKAGVDGLGLLDVDYMVGQFTATLDKRTGIEAIAVLLADPDVLYVSHEQTYTVSPKAGQTETWGLDRIDQRDLPLDGVYAPGSDRCGEDDCRRHVAIIDTGVTDVDDFSGRLIEPCATQHRFRGCDDGHGHGTHVAGTVGGLKWGVAEPWLHSSRVLGEDGSGTTSQVIAGINVVAEWAQADGAVWVANMSLGGPPDPPLDQAVCDAIAAGVVMVVAAGNDYGDDPNSSSPARVVQALTVGATHRSDRAADFSNSGAAIDLWAPGEDITSDRPGGGTATFSGTSMAAPHVAGAVVLYLDRHPDATVAEVVAGVIDAASQDKLQGVGDSPNRLLFVKGVSK